MGHTQPMTDRQQQLREDGWIAPVDGSPVDTPAGWTGGKVTNTGGNMYCRIWRRGALEVIYNLSNTTVGLQANNPDGGPVEEITSVSVEETDDLQMALAAVGLMSYANISDHTSETPETDIADRDDTDKLLRAAFGASNTDIVERVVADVLGSDPIDRQAHRDGSFEFWFSGGTSFTGDQLDDLRTLFEVREVGVYGDPQLWTDQGDRLDGTTFVHVKPGV